MIRPGFIGAISSQRGESQVVTERNITGAQSLNAMAFDYNTPFATVEAALPTGLNVTLDDATIAPLNISDWLPGSYNQAVAGTYTIDGDIQLLSGITNSTNIQAHINVTVNAAVTYDVFVDPAAPNDSANGLTISTPKKTIPAAITVAQGLGGSRTIKSAAGTHTLSLRIQWPNNISFVGAGIDVTTINGIEALNSAYVTGSFIWGFDLALLKFETGGGGNLTMSDFTLDCSKLSNSATRGMRLGIHVENKSNIILKRIKVRKSTFTGIRFSTTVTNCQVTDCDFIDNSYGETQFATGNVMWAGSTNLEIDNNTVDESFGNGMKAFGPPPASPTVSGLRLHDNHVSVVPFGQWNNGQAPNIAIEQWGMVTINCQFYNNYLDNTMSLVTNSPLTNGVSTFHVYNNTFDMVTRANNAGYCLELSDNYAQVNNNYMISGSNGTIINWQGTQYPQYGDWSIHHNIIKAPQAFYPSGIVRSVNKGLRNVNFDNNTIHVPPAQNQQVLLFVTYNSGSSSNINIRNNIFIDESTQNSQWGENALVQISGTAQNLVVSNNYCQGIPVGSVAGGSYSNNSTANPQLTKSGASPDPYYRPLPGSPVIAAGINVGLPFTGAAPTIGAYELAAPVTTGDIVSVETIPAISITTGIAWAAVLATLPTNATVTLNDVGNTQVNVPITWAQGTYDSSVEDTYNITGTFNTLPSGVTNTGNKTATIAITVTAATVEFTDSFNRSSLGANYVVQGNVTATLDGADMTMSVTGAAANTDRIVRVTWDDTIDNARIATIFSPSTINSTSIGLGIGFQNAVNPSPNKGVLLLFDNSTGPNAGRVSIMSGDGTLNNNSFVTRVSSSSALPVIAARRYLSVLTRQIVGADAVFTAVVTDLITDAFVTVVWTETGAVSMLYNQQITMYQFGGDRIVEDLTAYDMDVVTSTVLVDDIFDRVTLTPWTEVDAASQLTVTLNNPYVTLTSAVFAPSRLINHDTALGTLLHSWRMTIDFRFTAGAGGGFLVGVKNFPVNPNVNRAIFCRVDQSASKLAIFTGDGTTNDDAYSQQNLSSGTMTFTNNLDYRVVLERTYSGSGDSVYLATVYLISTPGTTITSTYTWTSAPEQALYASTKWMLSLMGNTVQVRHAFIEGL